MSRPNYPRRRRLSMPGELPRRGRGNEYGDELVVIALTHCDRPLARILWMVDETLAVDVHPRGQFVDRPQGGMTLNVHCTPPCNYDGIFSESTLTTLIERVRAQGLTRLTVDVRQVEQLSD